MDEPSKTFAPELSPAGSRQWIGRLVVAVVLGAAIWNFVVSLTSSVVVPALARVMEADPQSPLYLGKGDFNIPALFTALLELCFAVIAALMVNSWSQRRPRLAQRKSPRPAPVTTSILSAPAPKAVPSPSAPASSQSVPPVSTAPRQTAAPIASSLPTAQLQQAAAQPQAAPAAAAPAPVAARPAAQPAPAPPSAKPEKPKPPKKVYYNLVGDPIESDDE